MSSTQKSHPDSHTTILLGEWLRMRSRSANTWRMGKRKTAELEHHETAAAGKKRAKKGEDPCGKFLSLVATEDTVIAGGFQPDKA